MIPANLMEVFNTLPAEVMLKHAHSIQSKLVNDASLASLKTKDDYVTQADIDLQQIILMYFAQSELAGTYVVKAEETLEASQLGDASAANWQLLIDPIDGTNAFCKQQSTWGIMVGACDVEGVLEYSWNVLANGTIFSTDTASQTMLTNAKDVLERVDLFDYGVTTTQFFPQQTSSSSAIWAGWRLYTGELDGLLWLPSNAGKKHYPSFDLIFLGTLTAQGWKVRLGKQSHKVVFVAVASTITQLDRLQSTVTLPDDIIFTDRLTITSAL